MQCTENGTKFGVTKKKLFNIFFSKIICSFALGITPSLLHAEYADVVLNKRAEKEGINPVVFPHWFHRIRFKCRVCHSELGFEMRAGANQVTMDEITQGKFCGACHDGETAWSTENCDLCHTALPGIKSGIYGGHETTGPGRW